MSDTLETKEAELQTDELSEEKNPIRQLADMLAELPDAPSKVKIEKWKEIHGEIFCSGFTDEEIVVWRPMNRKEFVLLQEEAQSNKEVNQYDLEERVVANCILWQTVQAEKAFQQKAGSLTTLNEQIMQNSNFMNPQVASAYVFKL